MCSKYHALNQIIASILVNSIYAMINYPVVLINTLLAPLSLLIIVTFASHGTLLPIAAEGAIIMNVISSGTSLQGDLSHLKNDMKAQEMIVSSPTGAGIYVTGMAISELVYSIPTLSVLVILNIIFVKVTYLAGLYICMDVGVVFIFSTSLGFLLSTFSSDIVESWAFSGILSPLLATIPPVYYPISYIPYPYRYLAYLSPTTYAAEIAQSAAGLVYISYVNLILAWGILISVTFFVLFIAITRSRWVDV